LYLILYIADSLHIAAQRKGIPLSDSFCSLADLFVDADRASTCFGYSDTSKYNFSSFHTSVSRLAKFYKEREERTWCLLAQDAHLFAQNFFALLYAGKKIVLPPNAKLGTLRDLAAEYEAIASDEPQLIESELETFQLPSMEELLSQGNDGLDLLSAALVPEKCEIVVFTSGSSGNIKAVHKNLQHFDDEVASLELLWGKSLGRCLVLSTVCHQHIYGLLFAVLWPLAAGRGIYQKTVYYPEAVSSILARNQNDAKEPRSVLISSPAHLSRIPEYLNLAPYRECCTKIFSSGGPCSKETVGSLWERGAVEVTEVFGSTESGGVAFRVQENGRVDAGVEDLWTPMPGVRIRGDGDLLYVQSPFASYSETSDEWLAMGDSVHITDKGSFQLLGRSDCIVKVEERRFSPVEMEEQLCSHPYVNEASVQIVASDRGQMGTRDIVCAMIIPSSEGWDYYSRSSRQSFLSIIREPLSKRFEGVLLPKRWRVCQAMPLNSQGKRVLSEIKQVFEEPIPTADGPETLSIDFRRSELRLELRASSGLRELSGHFPGFPIVPGYLLIDWAVDAFRRFFLVDADVRRFEALKFRRMLMPNQRFVMELSYASGDTRFSFVYRDSEGVLCSGRVSFAPIKSEHHEKLPNVLTDTSLSRLNRE
jgi:acyl-coenzyme A synthetase/AMP-(fatty) acid ligase